MKLAISLLHKPIPNLRIIYFGEHHPQVLFEILSPNSDRRINTTLSNSELPLEENC